MYFFIVACPSGYFKDTVGNDECQPCPQEAVPQAANFPRAEYSISCMCPYYNSYTSCPGGYSTIPAYTLGAREPLAIFPSHVSWSGGHIRC